MGLKWAAAMNGTQEEQRYFTSAIVFGVMAALGVMLSYASVEDFSRARTCHKWPTVEGVVLSSDNGALRYAYFYDGVSHEGDRNKFVFGLPIKADTPISGEIVDVFVSPQDPTIAVLQPGGSIPLFAGAIGVSIVFVFIGLAGAVRAMSFIDLEAAPELEEHELDDEHGFYEPAE